ncbi:sporulation protein YqfD [Virgibacillus sp. MSJ-26]|uniref:sporulation protein YqfD n=1 Tax=Virgibacillus sp. MSJ-26 TaxID=2841522 RepID=UPI001C125314|nr:sporulation protein YqfD [Virgibacillus sp. MSJ-26]MBU5466432.1 sporulation protein YqfD [Virgibacillus sp. MSJ-26]
MKPIQGSFLSGYVRISIEGHLPEMFFQSCINQSIPVWNIKKEAKDKCSGNIKLEHVQLIKRINRQHRYKIKFTQKKGIPFFFNRFLGKKELIFGLIVGIMLVIFLSNIIWKVEITGVPKDLEEKISEQLTSYGIHPGVWKFTLDSPGDIQRQLEEDVPELLWVGVHKKGTTFVLEGVEKLIVEKEKVQGPRDLVATKTGVIKKMYVSKGQPKVQVNDYVEPGDLLVSGNLTNKDDEEDSEKGEKKPIYVSSEGEVIANTWYELSVTVPLKTNHERLTGNQVNKYYLQMNDINIPIWGFRSPEYELSTIENEHNAIRFLRWQLPVNIVKSTISEKEHLDMERSKEEAIKTGVEQAKKELKLQLGSDVEITSEKLLHQTIENGKVKLKLYTTVEENIVKEQPIKGDDKNKKE